MRFYHCPYGILQSNIWKPWGYDGCRTHPKHSQCVPSKSKRNAIFLNQRWLKGEGCVSSFINVELCLRFLKLFLGVFPRVVILFKVKKRGCILSFRHLYEWCQQCFIDQPKQFLNVHIAYGWNRLFKGGSWSKVWIEFLFFFFVAIVFITSVTDVCRISGTSDWDWMNELNKDCNFGTLKKHRYGWSRSVKALFWILLHRNMYLVIGICLTR